MVLAAIVNALAPGLAAVGISSSFRTETGLDVAKVAAVGFVGAFGITALADRLFAQRLKPRYFVLHVGFNSWLATTVVRDAFLAAANPLESMQQPFIESGAVTTSAIAGFHLYHMVAFTDLTTEDVVHHLVNCGLNVALGVFCPLGRTVPLSNFFMCGLPGGIDYAMLSLVKFDMMCSLTEKRINRWLNLCLRWPGQFLATYVGLLGMSATGWNRSIWLVGLMSLVLILHGANAIYYCDKVIGNYYVRKYQHLQRTQ